MKNGVEVKGYRLPPSEYQIFLKEWERMKKAGEIPEDCKPNIGSLPVEEDEKIKDLTIVYSTHPRDVITKPYVKKPYHRYYPL